MSKLEIEIGAVTDGLSKGLKDAESKLQRFSQTAVSVGKTLSLAITTPLVGLAAVAVKTASDTEESFSKFGTVFRDVAKQAEDSFGTLRNEYGLSSLAAKTLLGDTGDLLTGFGFAQTTALELATEVNKLAVDLASFTNFSGGAAGASQALTKALLGERESVKALGISILEEDVKKQVAINTAKGLTFETERQAKAFATLDLAIQQSGNAIGDYERTQDSFANQTRLLRARLSDLTAEFGEVLLPIATKLTQAISRLVERFSGLSEETRRTIVIVGAIAAAIGPLLVVLGSLGAALPLIASGFAAVKVAVIAATGPFGLIAAAIGAAIFLLIDLNRELKRTSEIAGEVRASNLDETTKNIKNEVDELAKSYQRINTDLTENEAKQKALNTVLEAYETRLKSIQDTDPGNLNRISFLREQIGAIKNLQNEFNGLTVEVTKTGQSAKLTFEEFSKLADIANQKVFSKFAEDARVFNDELRETIDLQRRLEQFSGEALQSIQNPFTDISNQIIADVVRIGEPVKEIADEFETTFEKIGVGIDELSGSFIGLGSIIGKAFNNTGLGAFAGQFAQFAAKLIASNFKIATSAGIASASTSAAATGPAAIFTLPAFISSAVGLIATAFSGIGGGSGRSVSAGSGVGSGVSQNISGGGAQGFGFDRSINLSGEFRASGADLVYVINQSQNYRN